MSESNNENNNNPLYQAPIEKTGDIFINNNIEKEEKGEIEEKEEKEEKKEKEETKQIEIKEVKEEKEQKENVQENNEKKDDININSNITNNKNNVYANNNPNQNPPEDNSNNLPSYQNFQENLNNNIYKNIPKQNNIPPNNNLPNNNNNFNENNKRYDHDNKKISQIIEKCESLYKQSLILYDNYDIQKAIINLSNAIKGLDGLKQSIVNNKTEFNNFLPQVTSMRTKYFNYLHKYHLTIYQLIPRKFSPIRFNQGENIQE